MNKQNILEAISKLKEVSPERKFKQSFDLILNLKGINLKKPEEKVEIFLTLPHSKVKKQKICALIGNELNTQAKSIFDKVILREDFSKFTKKEMKKLAQEYDFFIAQANIMPQIATTFGKVLGPKQKMPNPKAGCVVPPTAALKPLYDKLQNLVPLVMKNEAVIRATIGKEDMKDEEVAENIHAVYTAVLHALPKEKQNLKSVLLKLSMGPIVEITEKGPKIRQEEEKRLKAKGKSKKE